PGLHDGRCGNGLCRSPAVKQRIAHRLERAMYYAQHVPRILCLSCTHPSLGNAGLKSPLSGLHTRTALDLTEPTLPYGDLCPGLLRLSAGADGPVCGIPLVWAATLDLAFFLAQHGSYRHHRGGWPPQKG